MPHRKLIGPGEKREDQRAQQHRNNNDDQRAAPLEPLGEGADDGAEERHRQHPQHGQERDDKG